MVPVLTGRKYRLPLDSSIYSKYEKELQAEGWPRQLSGILSQTKVSQQVVQGRIKKKKDNDHVFLTASAALVQCHRRTAFLLFLCDTPHLRWPWSPSQTLTVLFTSCRCSLDAVTFPGPLPHQKPHHPFLPPLSPCYSSRLHSHLTGYIVTPMACYLLLS